MFDKGKIARQALERAQEVEKRIKLARKRIAIISGVCATGLCVFLFTLSSGILPLTNDQAYIHIDDPKVPLAASIPAVLAENEQTTCPVCGHEFIEDDETP